MFVTHSLVQVVGPKRFKPAPPKHAVLLELPTNVRAGAAMMMMMMMMMMMTMMMMTMMVFDGDERGTLKSPFSQ